MAGSIRMAAACVTLLVGTGACLGAGPSESDVAAVQVCRDLMQSECEAAYAAIFTRAPEFRSWSIQVAAPQDPDYLQRRGGDFVILVAFARSDAELLASPVIWAASRRIGQDDFESRPWPNRPLPPTFEGVLRLVAASG